MENVFLLCSNVGIRFAIIYGLVFAPVLLSANDFRRCVVCEEEIPEDADLELFEEFEKAFERFEVESEQEEEAEEAHKKGFLKKWCKKLKKWFAKKVYKIFKKMTGIKKIKNGEDCAYTIAKFKRKMDKKFNKQITVDEMFEKFDEHTDSVGYNNMIKFKERVKFYHKNKHEKPHSHEKDEQEKDESQLKGVPLKVLVGGTGIFCGTIIMFIPLPGCKKLGAYIIETGITLIASAYIDPMLEDKQQEEPKK